MSKEAISSCSDSSNDGRDLISYSHFEKSFWLKKLTENYPSLDACQKVAERTSCLQSALQQICEFPHYWYYRQISQSLALCLWEKQMVDAWETNQARSMHVEIAAHLTDSMHVTFQHAMSADFCFKLCKNFWKMVNQDEALIDKNAKEEAQNVLRFGSDVTEKFKERLVSLQADWTMVQMTIANFDPSNPGRGQIFVTRINHEQEPITIGLPHDRSQFLKYANKTFNTVISCLPLDCPPGEMQPILEILTYLQEVFLAGQKWLLRGQLDCVGQRSVQTYFDDAGRRAVSTILKEHGYHISYTELRSLLEILLEASEREILSLVECMWPPHVSGTMTHICMNIQKEVIKICQGQWREKRGPVILILDSELVHFPWESMPDLISDTVTRIPSLANLIALLTWHTQISRSPFKSGVERSTVTANIPLSSPEELVKELNGYFGDTWPDYNILQCIVTARAFAMIMSSRSGSLSADRKLDAGGPALYFLLAGCSAMMGHLWTPRGDDFSRISSILFSSWMSQSQPVSVRELMVPARQACEFPEFSGSGLVIYGLPTMIN